MSNIFDGIGSGIWNKNIESNGHYFFLYSLFYLVLRKKLSEKKTKA